MYDMLRITKLVPDLYHHAEIHFVEINSYFTNKQKQALSPCNKHITWHDDIYSPPQLPTIIVANAFS